MMKQYELPKGDLGESLVRISVLKGSIITRDGDAREVLRLRV